MIALQRKQKDTRHTAHLFNININNKRTLLTISLELPVFAFNEEIKSDDGQLAPLPTATRRKPEALWLEDRRAGARPGFKIKVVTFNQPTNKRIN